MATISTPSFLDTKAFSVFVSVALLCASIVCYALLVILYLSPQIYHLDSLIHPNANHLGAIKPTVAVGLIAALLSASTSGLVTRSVEHSLWRKLAPRNVRTKLTVGESHRLAQWCISPLSRLTYVLEGCSWRLRFSGLFLLAMSIVGPVLLTGISQHISTDTSTSISDATQDQFAGFMDKSNMAYNGGNFRDNLHEIAALASMSNLTTPSAPLCPPSDDRCVITAKAASIYATCTPSILDNPDKIGIAYGATSNGTLCSSYNDNLCVTLTSSSSATIANFTTGWTATCLANLSDPSCNGWWSVVFGAWTPIIGSDGSYVPQINTVDCLLLMGNATITQVGAAPPTLDRGSFARADYTLFGAWRRIYTSDAYASPYTFAAQVGGAAFNSLYQFPVGLFLLNYLNINDTASNAPAVARRLERNFDAAALMAFVRAPTASRIAIESSDRTQVWAYDKAVLAILLVPLLATVMALWGRWRVEGREVCVGYDPVEIAARGLVQEEPVSAGEGTTTEGKGSAASDAAVDTGGGQGRRVTDGWRVWGVQGRMRPSLMTG